MNLRYLYIMSNALLTNLYFARILPRALCPSPCVRWDSMQQIKSGQSVCFSRSYVLLALIGASVLSACGRSADTEPGTHTIVIRGFQYTPPTATVGVGDTVVWQNEDLVPHTATAEGKDLDTGSIKPNASSGQYIAKDKGSYAYDCTFHPTMKGTLVVR